MTIAEQMAAELAREAAVTRGLLARVPDDKRDWSPGAGLHTVGWNADHLAEIVGWVPGIVGASELDIAPPDAPPPPPPPAGADALLARFDAGLAASLAALRGVPDAVMDEPWTMKMGGHVLFTVPKGECLRTWVFSHTAHHRGILSAYLRLAGVPHASVFEG